MSKCSRCGRECTLTCLGACLRCYPTVRANLIAAQERWDRVWKRFERIRGSRAQRTTKELNDG